MKSGRSLDRIISVIREQQIHTPGWESGIGGLGPHQTSNQKPEHVNKKYGYRNLTGYEKTAEPGARDAATAKYSLLAIAESRGRGSLRAPVER
jgi:hypothetical protein